MEEIPKPPEIPKKLVQNSSAEPPVPWSTFSQLSCAVTCFVRAPPPRTQHHAHSTEPSPAQPGSLATAQPAGVRLAGDGHRPGRRRHPRRAGCVYGIQVCLSERLFTVGAWGGPPPGGGMDIGAFFLSSTES